MCGGIGKGSFDPDSICTCRETHCYAIPSLRFGDEKRGKRVRVTKLRFPRAFFFFFFPISLFRLLFPPWDLTPSASWSQVAQSVGAGYREREKILLQHGKRFYSQNRGQLFISFYFANVRCNLISCHPPPSRIPPPSRCSIDPTFPSVPCQGPIYIIKTTQDSSPLRVARHHYYCRGTHFCVIKQTVHR